MFMFVVLNVPLNTADSNKSINAMNISAATAGLIPFSI